MCETTLYCVRRQAVLGAGGGRGMVTFAGAGGLFDDILVGDLFKAAREEL